MIRTFIDAGVLIAAVRGVGEIGRRARDVLNDPARAFVSSVFVRLEVMPKAVYFRSSAELMLYGGFFAQVTAWAEPIDELIQRAYVEAASSGLAAMDALHVAAAVMASAQELVTTERLGRAIHRSSSIRIVTLSTR